MCLYIEPVHKILGGWSTDAWGTPLWNSILSLVSVDFAAHRLTRTHTGWRCGSDWQNEGKNEGGLKISEDV